MPETMTLTPSVQDKFARLADILQEASVLLRSLTRTETTRLENDDFWQECDELADAFSDLSEQQVTDLVNDAVRAVRTHQPITS